MTLSLKALTQTALLSSGFVFGSCVADGEPYFPDSDPKPEVTDEPDEIPPLISVNPEESPAPLPVVFADEQTRPSNLSVYGDSVYWVDFADNKVLLKRQDREGHEDVAVERLESLPFSVAVDDAGLYFATSSQQSITFVAHNALEAGPLHASITDPLAIAVTDDYVYWTAANGCLFQGPMHGGDAVVLACAPTAAIVLSLVGDFAYMGTVAGALYRVELTEGGIFDKIVSDEDFTEGLVADASALYWANAPQRQIRSYNYATESVTVLADSQLGLTSVRQDRFYLYFATQSDGAIKRMRKTTGKAATMTRQQGEPAGLVVTSEWVYWINEGNGSVMRQSKNFDY